MKYLKTYNENFISDIKTKFKNRKLEDGKYVYGDTVPTTGEINDAVKKYCLEKNWVWCENSYVNWAFGRGANSIINYMIDYSKIPSNEMIAKWAIEDDERFNGEIFTAGANYVINYQVEKDAKKYNL